MNARQIQYALALSESLNFSQVSEQLGITQPALSKQIQSLEKDLGVKLFERNHSPLVLTPAGEYFVRNARELLYKEEQMRKALERFRTGESGSLVIGVTPFRSLYMMPEIVKKVRKRYPGITVSLHEVPTYQLRKEAEEGKVDLAVVNLPVDTSLLDVTPLEPDILVLAVHEDMTEDLSISCNGNFEEVEFAQFRDLPFVVMSPERELRELFEKLCASAEFYPTIAAEVMGVTSAWNLAQAGVGATLLPLQFVHNQHLDSHIRLYAVKNSIYARQPVLVTRHGQVRTPYAEYAIGLLTGKEE